VSGRPSDYRPEYCAQVIELGKQGKSVVQMACAIEVAKSTLYLWEKEHPEFSDAFTRARQHAQDWWESKGQDSLEKPGFQSSLWSRSMAARFPEDYTERQKRELTGKDEGPIKTESDVTLRPPVTREEWLKAHGLG
jgi:hypothetical protein